MEAALLSAEDDDGDSTAHSRRDSNTGKKKSLR